MEAGARCTSQVPALPSQRSTPPDNGVESAFSPVLSANTTEAGMGKNVLGSNRSKSQGVL